MRGAIGLLVREGRLDPMALTGAPPGPGGTTVSPKAPIRRRIGPIPSVPPPATIVPDALAARCVGEPLADQPRTARRIARLARAPEPVRRGARPRCCTRSRRCSASRPEPGDRRGHQSRLGPESPRGDRATVLARLGSRVGPRDRAGPGARDRRPPARLRAGRAGAQAPGHAGRMGRARLRRRPPAQSAWPSGPGRSGLGISSSIASARSRCRSKGSGRS